MRGLIQKIEIHKYWRKRNKLIKKIKSIKNWEQKEQYIADNMRKTSTCITAGRVLMKLNDYQAYECSEPRELIVFRYYDTFIEVSHSGATNGKSYIKVETYI